MDIREIIGQIFGIIAVILGFVMYQIKDAKRILMVQIFICLVFCIHYFLLEATSGLILNAVGAARSITYYNRDKLEKCEKYLPVIFAVIMAIMGIFFWEAWYSIFVVVGLVINSVALSFKCFPILCACLFQESKKFNPITVSDTTLSISPFLSFVSE